MNPGEPDPGAVRHHFVPPDPADAVDRPTPLGEESVDYPRAPRPWWAQVGGQWPLLLGLVVTTVGVAVAAASYWRRGATIIGAGLLMVAVLRLLLPERRAGLLVVRSRAIDVATSVLLGAGILVVAWIVAPTKG